MPAFPEKFEEWASGREGRIMVENQQIEGGFSSVLGAAVQEAADPCFSQAGAQVSRAAGRALVQRELRSESILDQIAADSPEIKDSTIVVERQRITVRRNVPTPQEHAIELLVRVRELEAGYRRGKKRSDRQTAAAAVVSANPEFCGRREAFIPRADADAALSQQAFRDIAAMRDETRIAIYNLAVSMPVLAQSDSEFKASMLDARRDFDRNWERLEEQKKESWIRQKREIDCRTKLLSRQRADADAELRQEQKNFYAARQAAKEQLEKDFETARSQRSLAIESRRNTLKLIEELYIAQAQTEYYFEAENKSHREWQLNLMRDSFREKGDKDGAEVIEKKKQALSRDQASYRLDHKARVKDLKRWLALGANPAMMELPGRHKAA